MLTPHDHRSELMSGPGPYYGWFESWSDVREEFEIDIQEPDVLLAAYDYGHEGEAHVLFCDAGALYIVTGSHCSCYGLEGQWKPEEMPLSVLAEMYERLERQYGDHVRRRGSDVNVGIQELCAEKALNALATVGAGS